MAPKYLFVPLIILSTAATIIASQALISGSFSIIQQAITLGSFPRMKIVHTSDTVAGQVYIPRLNFILMILCIFLVLFFRTSEALSSAYGLAVGGDMALTTFLYSTLALLRWKWRFFPWLGLTVSFVIVDWTFLTSVMLKLPTGGYVPLIIATISFFVMHTWKFGRESIRRSNASKQIDFSKLKEVLEAEEIHRTPGTAVFMSSSAVGVPLTLSSLITHSATLQQTVIFLTINIKNAPNIQHTFVEKLEVPGFYRVIIQHGYRASKISMKNIFHMVNSVVPELQLDVNSSSFFLGNEKIRSVKKKWIGHRLRVKFFNMMLQVSHSVADSFKIPPTRYVTIGSEEFM